MVIKYYKANIVSVRKKILYKSFLLTIIKNTALKYYKVKL